MLENFKRAMSALFGKDSKSSESKSSSRGWTPDQERELVSMLKAGMSKSSICRVLGRSTNSINYKLISSFDTSSVKKLKSRI